MVFELTNFGLFYSFYLLDSSPRRSFIFFRWILGVSYLRFCLNAQSNLGCVCVEQSRITDLFISFVMFKASGTLLNLEVISLF